MRCTIARAWRTPTNSIAKFDQLKDYLFRLSNGVPIFACLPVFNALFSALCSVLYLALSLKLETSRHLISNAK